MRTDGGLGRLLFFWCNTTLLPELPTANGVWDDVFLMMWTEPYGIGLILPTVCLLPKDYMLFPSVARILASRTIAGMT